MLVAGWSLTKACNLNCMHCYNASGIKDKNELSTSECFDVIDKLKEAGVKAINFGGGECALRPDFIRICKYIRRKDILISYTTNGTTFDKIKNHLELFHDIGVSIDFANKKKHDWFRGRKGVYNEAIKTIKILVEKKIDNEIVTCLTKLNCNKKELQKLYNLSKRLRVNYWRLNRFRENGRGIFNEKDLALSKKELKIAYTYLNKFNRDSVLTPEPVFRSAFGGNYYFAGDPSGFTSFRIQPDGEVSPSVFLSESGGNIKYNSVKEIMYSEIFKKIRNRIPIGKCKKCSAYYHCKGGDAGASYLKYGHFNGPDPLCWLQPRGKKACVNKINNGEWNVHELYLCTLYIPIRGLK